MVDLFDFGILKYDYNFSVGMSVSQTLGSDVKQANSGVKGRGLSQIFG